MTTLERNDDGTFPEHDHSWEQVTIINPEYVTGVLNASFEKDRSKREAFWNQAKDMVYGHLYRCILCGAIEDDDGQEVNPD